MQSDKTIIILEDDIGCQFVYKEILDIRYQTVYFDSFTSFYEFIQLSDIAPSLVISDLKLKDGHFLNQFSKEQIEFLLKYPFLIISSTEDIDTIRYCIKKGALDYLIKPFKKNELIVKLEILLQKNNLGYQPSENQELPEEFDTHNLTKKEYNILKLFYATKNKTLSRKELVENIWCETNVHPKTLDVHLYNLRKKIEHCGVKIISSSPGVWKLDNSLEVRQ